MIKTLDEIKKRLIEQYDPDSMILYGSYGTEKERHDSDIDLLIIKDSTKSCIERQCEVERILSDRLLPLDIRVYTPHEIRFLFSVGSPFIEEVIERGRLLYMRKTTQVWIQDAEEELDTAVILLEHGKNRGACYHAQQSSEKGLKALIIEKGKRLGRIHDIVDLFNTVASIGYAVSLSMDDAIFLNSIYRGRYPTEEGLLPHGEPSHDDAQRAINASMGLLKGVKTLLGQ